MTVLNLKYFPDFLDVCLSLCLSYLSGIFYVFLLVRQRNHQLKNSYSLKTTLVKTFPFLFFLFFFSRSKKAFVWSKALHIDQI